MISVFLMMYFYCCTKGDMFIVMLVSLKIHHIFNCCINYDRKYSKIILSVEKIYFFIYEQQKLLFFCCLMGNVILG